MNREELKQYIVETYGAQAEYLWAKHPSFAVFRHGKKWFALVMDVPREKLGLSKDGVLDLVNVKCDPNLMGSLRAQPGFYPAYHMSKASWISVALDGSVGDETIQMLLDMSYDLTAVKPKKRRT